MNISRLTQRKFAIPSSAASLALANDIVGMGIDFKTMVVVVAASLAYALIEQLGDISRMKYGQSKK